MLQIEIGIKIFKNIEQHLGWVASKHHGCPCLIARHIFADKAGILALQ
jgi:hypothetical protein